jgi:hypothetical protein
LGRGGFFLDEPAKSAIAVFSLVVGMGMTMPKAFPAGQGKEGHGGQNRDPSPETLHMHGYKVNAGPCDKSIHK